MSAVTKYVLEQLGQIRTTPEMFGSAESVELQYLQLLETLVVAERTDLEEKDPRFVLNAYEKYRVQKGFAPNAPLASHLSVQKLVDALHEFQVGLLAQMTTPKSLSQMLRESSKAAEQVTKTSEPATVALSEHGRTYFEEACKRLGTPHCSSCGNPSKVFIHDSYETACECSCNPSSGPLMLLGQELVLNRDGDGYREWRNKDWRLEMNEYEGNYQAIYRRHGQSVAYGSGSSWNLAEVSLRSDLRLVCDEIRGLDLCE